VAKKKKASSSSYSRSQRRRRPDHSGFLSGHGEKPRFLRRYPPGIHDESGYGEIQYPSPRNGPRWI